MAKLDPSLALGFFCQTEFDLAAFFEYAYEQSKERFPLFNVS